jgi:nucleotide-binding universal stress UspA family protein
MFRSIVVGTDGSDTAAQAVSHAVDLARALGATLEIVCAFEPVPAQRLRHERVDAPEDLQWAINPRQDVDSTLEAAAKIAGEAGIAANTYARQGDPADDIIDVDVEGDGELFIVGD